MRNRPAMRWKWIYTIQMIWLSCCAASHPFVQRALQWVWFRKPHGITAWGLLWSWHDVPVLFQNPVWQAHTDMAVSLWVSRAKYQFCLQSLSWPFCSDSLECRSRHMVTWFGRHGDAFGTTFFHAFITLISQFHLHHCSQWTLMEIVSKITPNFGLVL